VIAVRNAADRLIRISPNSTLYIRQLPQIDSKGAGFVAACSAHPGAVKTRECMGEARRAVSRWKAAKASLRRFWSLPPFSKHGRSGLIDFPIEKIVVARPRVDLGLANLTLETAKMLIWMLLPCRSVRQPAIGTGKIFGHPYVACHPAIMPMWRLLHRPACPNSCATINERFNGMHRNRRGPTAPR
jgi:hypothetical protein